MPRNEKKYVDAGILCARFLQNESIQLAIDDICKEYQLPNKDIVSFTREITKLIINSFDYPRCQSYKDQLTVLQQLKKIARNEIEMTEQKQLSQPLRRIWGFQNFQKFKEFANNMIEELKISSSPNETMGCLLKCIINHQLNTLSSFITNSMPYEVISDYKGANNEYQLINAETRNKHKKSVAFAYTQS